MKFTYKLLLLSLIGLGGCIYAAGPSPKVYLTGANEDVVTQAEFGALLMGGGPEPDDAMEWLLAKAKGGDVVVLRASGSDGYNDYFYREIGGVNSVRSFVFSSREEAFADSVADAIEEAELIFIAGGDQSKYVRFWKGTPVQILLNAHVRQGKPIGGTSAGLAVLGKVSYSAMHDSIQSSEALQNPFSKHLTLETEFLQVPFLNNVVTDSHFSERGRLGRLLAFQARGRELTENAALIGLGVDESTCLAIDASGTAQIFSRTGLGRVYLTQIAQDTSVLLQEGAKLSIGEVMVIGLGRASSFSLVDLAVKDPAGLSLIEVVDGRIKELPK